MMSCWWLLHILGVDAGFSMSFANTIFCQKNRKILWNLEYLEP